MASSKVRIPLKLLIHKQQERVLYAEANSDFVDILFSFLTLPMGTIVKLLSNHSNTSKPPAVGSFNKLYESIANLEDSVFPNIPASTLEMLKNSGITDFGVLEERSLNLGSTEALNLLWAAMTSTSVLTNGLQGSVEMMHQK
ncbi:hypothetical protein AgCh_035260 [Apium graveolens]